MSPIRRLSVLYIVFWAFPVIVFYLLGMKPSAWKELISMQASNRRNLTARTFLVMLPSQVLFHLVALMYVLKGDLKSALIVWVWGLAISWLLAALYDISLHGKRSADHLFNHLSRREVLVSVALTAITVLLFQAFMQSARFSIQAVLTLLITLAVPTGAVYAGMRLVSPPDESFPEYNM